MTFLLILLACAAEPPEGTPVEGGTWRSVRPPPGAPPDLVCWVYLQPLGESTWGGPACFRVPR